MVIVNIKNKNIIYWAALIGLGGILRIINIGSRSIWLDEAYSIKLASHSFPYIIKGTAMDIHPPLFHIVLSVWLKLFGHSESDLRSLSIIFGLLLIPVAYKLTATWVSRRAGWIAAFLVAISPYFIEISRIGRMPAMLAFFMALSLYFFRNTIHTNSKLNTFGFLFAMLAGLYTHYFSILLLLAFHLYIFMGIGKLNLTREIRKKWFLLQLALLAGYAPWITTLWNHLIKGGPGWRGLGAAWHEPIHVIYNLILGTANWQWQDKIISVSLLVLATVLIICLIKNPIKTIYEQLLPHIWGLMISVLVIVFGVVWLYSNNKLNVFDHRYLSVVALIVIIILSITITLLKKPRQYLVLAIISAAFAIPIFNQLFNNQYYDNWRGVAKTIEQTVSNKTAIAVYPAWNETPLGYYLKDDYDIIGLPGYYDPISGKTAPWFHLEPGNLKLVEERLRNRQNVVLLLVNQGRVQHLLQEWFDRTYKARKAYTDGSIQFWIGESI